MVEILQSLLVTELRPSSSADRSSIAAVVTFGCLESTLNIDFVIKKPTVIQPEQELVPR